MKEFFVESGSYWLTKGSLRLGLGILCYEFSGTKKKLSPALDSVYVTRYAPKSVRNPIPRIL